MKSCIYRKWSNELQASVCEFDIYNSSDIYTSVVCDAEYCAGCQVREEREEDL